MPYTNRELIASRDTLEAELYRLKTLQRMSGRAADATRINEQIAELNRERVALCAAIVHRRFEASKDVVSFSRWVSGNGAINAGRPMRPARRALQPPSFRASAPINLKEAFSRLLAAD